MFLSLLLLSSSCELFLLVIDGNLTRGIFYWLWFVDSLAFDLLNTELLFYDGLKILLLFMPNSLFYLLVSFFTESPLSLRIILGGKGTKLTHLWSV